MLGVMKLPTKNLRLFLIGLCMTVLVLSVISIIPLKKMTEFAYAEHVKGYWVSLQDFANKNGHYPKNDAEVGAFFHETSEQVKREPVEYVAPQDTNADEVVLWWKTKTMFGVRVGITESGTIVKQ